MAVIGNLETMVLGEQCVLLVAVRLLEGLIDFFVEHVRDAFEEEQREDVRLEIGRIDGPAKDVGGLPKVVRESR